ncbi:hypothetical protein AB0O20_36645 [Streptomyces kronopolitis]|uniref:hypothetical protein n=1 Tax=Streptomyces kronopolitis TaxID=1612435 RepID=UPI003421692F
MRRLDEAEERRDGRLEATGEERHRLRAEAFAVAHAARRLAAQLEAQAQQEPWRQPAWSTQPRSGRSAAPYTRAARDILNTAEHALAQAVTADRAAGQTWADIGAALGVSADTAARRYRHLPH